MAVIDAAVDAGFDTFGVAATYTAPGGSPVACRLILDRSDAVESIRGARFVEGQTVVEVRSSEIAAPAKGGVFAAGSITYTIVEAPRREDAERLIWSCLVRASS